MDHEQIYLTSEVSEILDISVPTVRNYAKALERAGHEFKMRKQARLWTANELGLVREVQHLYNTKDYPLEICFQYVVKKQQEGEAAASELLSQPQLLTPGSALAPELAQIITEEFKELRNEVSKINKYSEDINELKALFKNDADAQRVTRENEGELLRLKKENGDLNTANEKLNKELETLEREKKELEQQINAIKDMNTLEFWKFKKE